MPDIAIFCEDTGHEMVVKPLVERIVRNSEFTIHVLSSHGGSGRALNKFEKYLRDVERGNTLFSADIIVVAIDANCKKYSGKRKIIDEIVPEKFRDRVVHCIPDPHVERWMLIDSSAFKKALGQGCNAPDLKCEKGRYKQLLKEAVIVTGNTINLGGFEHAEEIIHNMSEKAMRSDASLRKFMNDLCAKVERFR